MCPGVDARRLATSLSAFILAAVAAAGANAQVVAVDLKLKGMRALTADWKTADFDDVRRDLAHLLQQSSRLSPWSFRALEGEAQYRLLFKVENTRFEQIHLHAELLIRGEGTGRALDLAPVDPMNHIDELLLLEPDEVGRWLTDRLQAVSAGAQENRGNLSLLRARLAEHVPIAREGRWRDYQQQLHIHLPLDENRYGSWGSNLGSERFRIDCLRQTSRLIERSWVQAQGIDVWMPYESRARDYHLLVKPLELRSAGHTYKPKDKQARELSQHEPQAVYLQSFTFSNSASPKRIPRSHQ